MKKNADKNRDATFTFTLNWREALKRLLSGCSNRVPDD